MARHVGELEFVAAAHHTGGVIVHLQQLRGGRGLGEGSRGRGRREGELHTLSFMPLHLMACRNSM